MAQVIEGLENVVEYSLSWLYWGSNNFYRNATHMFDDMNVKNWIRIIAIVGAYLLLRPYLLKLMEKKQAEGYEKEFQKSAEGDKKAVLSPNALRDGGVQEEDIESEAEGEATGAQWGKKARKRQRDVLERILKAEEKLRREDDAEERKELHQFLQSDDLVDYKEGEDGW